MKKIFAILLAAIMMLSMAAMADTDPKGTIIVDGYDSTQEYNLYRLLDLEWNEQTQAYRYILNTKWSGFFTTGAGKDYVALNTTEVEGVTYVTATTLTEATAPAFAEAALAYAEANSISADVLNAAGNDVEGKLTFSELELGYYLVDTSLGSLCALDTTTTSATVIEKNAAATTDSKLVKEDSTAIYGESNDDDMLNTVEYTVTVTAQAGAENYVLHDVMADGLDFGAVTSITKNGTAVTAEGNYTVETEDVCEGCDFEVVFTKTFCDALADNDKIVVSYTATLNKDAEVGAAGNKNTAWLTYGDDNTTAEKDTYTYTWQFEVFKHNDANVGLQEAKFTLSKNTDGSNPYTFVETATTNTYRVAAATETGATSTITTDTTGKFILQGLDADVYYLTETVAPDGYNKLTAPIQVKIEHEVDEKNPDVMTSKLSVFNTKTKAYEEVTTVNVLNLTGSELPSTGGIGTTIFYVVGGLMMAAAVVLLVSKRKVAASK